MVKQLDHDGAVIRDLGVMLVSKGRQAAMSGISPEFQVMERSLEFLQSRHAPRMSSQDAGISSS